MIEGGGVTFINSFASLSPRMNRLEVRRAFATLVSGRQNLMNTCLAVVLLMSETIKLPAFDTIVDALAEVAHATIRAMKAVAILTRSRTTI